MDAAAAPSPAGPTVSPVLLSRTFAYALLSWSLFAGVGSAGFSAVSSILCLSMAASLLCMSARSIETEAKHLPTASPRSTMCGFVSAGCGGNNSFKHIIILCIVMMVFACVEVGVSVAVFAAAGIPFTGRYTERTLSTTQRPDFSPTSLQPFTGFTFQTAPPISSFAFPTPAFGSTLQSFDSGEDFTVQQSGCMYVSSQLGGLRFRSTVSQCGMTSENLWRAFWNSGINSYTAGYRGYLLSYNDNTLRFMQQDMFRAYNNAFTSTSLGTFATLTETVIEVVLSCNTALAAIASATNVLWGALTLSLLFGISPGAHQPSTTSIFAFLHYARTPFTMLMFSFALAFVVFGIAMLPGPTALAGISCITLGMTWLNALREPKVLQEASQVKRLRFTAFAVCAAGAVQIGLAIVTFWAAVNVGQRITPPTISQTLPTVPSVSTLRPSFGQPFFLGSGLFAVTNIGNTFPPTQSINDGSTDVFTPVNIGSTFYGPLNCIAASAIQDNDRYFVARIDGGGFQTLDLCRGLPTQVWTDFWANGNTITRNHDQNVASFNTQLEAYFDDVWETYVSEFATFTAPLVNYYLTSTGAMVAAGVICIVWSCLTLTLVSMMVNHAKTASDNTVVVTSVWAAARLNAATVPAAPTSVGSIQMGMMPPPPPPGLPPSSPPPGPPPSIPSFIPPPPAGGPKDW